MTRAALALTISLVLLQPSSVRAQEGFRAWIGLYNDTQLAWLENENRVSELCRDAVDASRCYSDKWQPLIAIHTLHREPSESSPAIGDLLVVAVPGRGLSAHFRAADTNEVSPVEVDLRLQDWGYGPYFHHTILARRNTWFQLPEHPWDGPVWVNRAGEDEASTVIGIQSGDIIEMEGSGFYVVDAEPDVLVLRPEQPADIWCETGDPPATLPAAVRRVPRSELVDSRGHLVFRLRYLKGC